MFPVLSTLVFFFFFAVLARIMNVTIDDTAGDERAGTVPQYMPNWTPRSVDGAPCKGCSAQPDGTRAFKGTWHDRSTHVKDHPSTVSINFSGTRIYVFFILFNNIGSKDKNTRLRFYLDGSADAAGDFLHLPDPAGVKYLYDQLVFDSKSLELADHTLLVSSYANNTTGSLALFDYAIYTTEDVSNSSSIPTHSPGGAKSRGGRASHVGLAINALLAGVLVLTLLLGSVYWIYSRRQRLLLRSESGWLREELERVRRIAEPPPDYTSPSQGARAS